MTISIILRAELGDACHIDHTPFGLIIETGRPLEVVHLGRQVLKLDPGRSNALPSLPDPV